MRGWQIPARLEGIDKKVGKVTVFLTHFGSPALTPKHSAVIIPGRMIQVRTMEVEAAALMTIWRGAALYRATMMVLAAIGPHL
jgi:hypothetical protein